MLKLFLWGAFICEPNFPAVVSVWIKPLTNCSSSLDTNIPWEADLEIFYTFMVYSLLYLPFHIHSLMAEAAVARNQSPQYFYVQPFIQIFIVICEEYGFSWELNCPSSDDLQPHSCAYFHVLKLILGLYEITKENIIIRAFLSLSVSVIWVCVILAESDLLSVLYWIFLKPLLQYWAIS